MMQPENWVKGGYRNLSHMAKSCTIDSRPATQTVNEAVEVLD